MNTNPNDCAYPADNKTQTEGGLTKREYFAAMALMGLCAGAKQVPDDNPEQALAKCAIELADALIEQLNKQP